MHQSHETYRQSLIINLGEIIRREAGKILAERLASSGLIVSVKEQDKAFAEPVCTLQEGLNNMQKEVNLKDKQHEKQIAVQSDKIQMLQKQMAQREKEHQQQLQAQKDAMQRELDQMRQE